ncbi:phenylacetate--CoA ligase family protein [Methanohalophilus sp. RSK]|uniref:phenylacetate--CoA ligase family protein n=1 Tax=Methanohalophilus sp. RSK TaxID=2485783 RepID=UPI000F43BD45|nr:phenylacetate--CoA ligase family protein [Methanohalophilus sp. RSK]RNI15774.1 phenylacetate--CoA ligase family protein [Methanohalophilus sp. RSK]
MLHKPLFILAHQIGDRNFYPTYKRLLANQWQSYARQKESQEIQLRKMVDFVWENVPYYHKLFRELGIVPADIRQVEDLEKLPILTKEIIKKNWEDFKPKNLRSMKYYERSTGGSTGVPLKYRISKYDRFLSGALLYRGWGYGGYSLGDKIVFLAGSSLDIHPKSTLYDRIVQKTRNSIKLSAFDMDANTMNEFVDILNSFEPKFIRGYASSIYLFANHIEKNGLRICSPKSVFTTAEKLYPHMRKKISSVFNCDVFDGYGLNDGGVSAYECRQHSGLHIDTERSVMEITSDEGKQLDYGTGKILATTLHNFAMPLIRYDTGDLGVLKSGICSCGRGSKLLSEIVGRDKEMLMSPTGKYIHGAALYNDIVSEMKNANNLVECQIIQTCKELIIFNMVCKKQFEDGELEHLRHLIKRKNDGLDVQFKYVNKLSKTNAGKHKFIISELDT